MIHLYFRIRDPLNVPFLDGQTTDQIKGEWFVQLEEISDISLPINDRYITSKSPGSRTLLMLLTDGTCPYFPFGLDTAITTNLIHLVQFIEQTNKAGRQQFMGVEGVPIPWLHVNVPWGCKLKLKGPIPLQGGFALLHPHNVTYMGGFVLELQATKQAMLDYLQDFTAYMQHTSSAPHLTLSQVLHRCAAVMCMQQPVPPVQPPTSPEQVPQQPLQGTHHLGVRTEAPEPRVIPSTTTTHAGPNTGTNTTNAGGTDATNPSISFGSGRVPGGTAIPGSNPAPIDGTDGTDVGGNAHAFDDDDAGWSDDSEGGNGDGDDDDDDDAHGGTAAATMTTTRHEEILPETEPQYIPQPQDVTVMMVFQDGGGNKNTNDNSNQAIASAAVVVAQKVFTHAIHCQNQDQDHDHDAIVSSLDEQGRVKPPLSCTKRSPPTRDGNEGKRARRRLSDDEAAKSDGVIDMTRDDPSQVHIAAAVPKNNNNTPSKRAHKQLLAALDGAEAHHNATGDNVYNDNSNNNNNNNYVPRGDQERRIDEHLRKAAELLENHVHSLEEILAGRGAGGGDGGANVVIAPEPAPPTNYTNDTAEAAEAIAAAEAWGSQGPQPITTLFEFERYCRQQREHTTTTPNIYPIRCTVKASLLYFKLLWSDDKTSFQMSVSLSDATGGYSGVLLSDAFFVEQYAGIIRTIIASSHDDSLHACLHGGEIVLMSTEDIVKFGKDKRFRSVANQGLDEIKKLLRSCVGQLVVLEVREHGGRVLLTDILDVLLTESQEEALRRRRR